MFKRPGTLSSSSFGVRFTPGVPEQQAQAAHTGGALPPPAKRPRKDDAAAGAGSVGGGDVRLPIDDVRRQLLWLVERHATVVLVGETGCGKTTRVPRMLHEAGWTAAGHQVRHARRRHRMAWPLTCMHRQLPSRGCLPICQSAACPPAGMQTIAGSVHAASQSSRCKRCSARR
jgi:hypothetical protein